MLTTQLPSSHPPPLCIFAKIPHLVAYFKASLVGFHAADHGLDPEDEVATLRAVMQAFATSVEEAKTGKSAIAAPVNAGGSHEAIDRLD